MSPCGVNRPRETDERAIARKHEMLLVARARAHETADDKRQKLFTRLSSSRMLTFLLVPLRRVKQGCPSLLSVGSENVYVDDPPRQSLVYHVNALILYGPDQVRRRARDLAWNGQDGQMSARYNRFERMRRRTQESDGPYQLEVPIEIVNRIYELPARTDQTQSAQPSYSAPQCIVHDPEVAYRPSRHSGDAISEHSSRPARPGLRSDSPDLQLDQAIQSARYSRGGSNIFRALRVWLSNLILRFKLVCSECFFL